MSYRLQHARDHRRPHPRPTGGVTRRGDGQRHDEGRKHHEQDADAVHAHLVTDIAIPAKDDGYFAFGITYRTVAS